MSRRTIVITIIIIIVAFLVIAFIFWKKSGTPAEEQNGTKENTGAATLPPAEEIYKGHLPVESVKSADQPDYINQAVSDFNAKTLNGEDVSPGYQQAVLVDENKKIIPLDKFESAQNISINKKLKSFLDQDDFQIANCNSAKAKGIALILNVKLFSNRPDISKEVAGAMKEWEPYILKDLHNYLYPDISFSEKQLGETLFFKQGKFRYAEVALSNGEKVSINYAIIFDSIIISNSPGCLDKIYESAETGEP